MDREKIRKIQDILSDLRDKKNATYKDSYAKYGPVNIATRISEKLDRFINVSDNTVSIDNTESAIDTMADMINYGLFFLEQQSLSVEELRKMLLKE